MWESEKIESIENGNLKMLEVVNWNVVVFVFYFKLRADMLLFEERRRN